MPPNKTVPNLYPEAEDFGVMPEVFATGFMVGLIEWTCIQLVDQHLGWPAEMTLGIHVDVSHESATPPGLTVTTRVELTKVDGRLHRRRREVQGPGGVQVRTGRLLNCQTSWPTTSLC